MSLIFATIPFTMMLFRDIQVKMLRMQTCTLPHICAAQSSKGRTVSLSACGGKNTLRLCLDMCIPRLTALLDENIKAEDSNRDK
jgi:hypothetical protein